jgi:hypothetical protein
MENNADLNHIPSVYEDDIIEDEAFSYTGYQVVRGEFFAHLNEPSISFNKGKVAFSTACVNKVPEIDYVQILVNPNEMKLAVRPCNEDEKDSFLWSAVNVKTSRKKPRAITCRMFFAKLSQLMDWNPEYRYKMLGKLIQSNEENLFIFDLTATEIYQSVQQSNGKPRTSRTPVFPADWQNQFGLPVEEHRKSLQVNIFEGSAVFGINDAEGIEKIQTTLESEGIVNE